MRVGSAVVRTRHPACVHRVWPAGSRGRRGGEQPVARQVSGSPCEVVAASPPGRWARALPSSHPPLPNALQDPFSQCCRSDRNPTAEGGASAEALGGTHVNRQQSHPVGGRLVVVLPRKQVVVGHVRPARIGSWCFRGSGLVGWGCCPWGWVVFRGLVLPRKRPAGAYVPAVVLPRKRRRLSRDDPWVGGRARRARRADRWMSGTRHRSAQAQRRVSAG